MRVTGSINDSGSLVVGVEDVRQIEEYPAEIMADRTVSPWQVFTEIFRLALPMSASFTFSFSALATGYMGNRFLKNTGRTANLGGVTLITTMLYVWDLFIISPLFSISIFTSNKRGDLDRCMGDAIAEDEIKEEIFMVFKNGAVLGSFMLPVPMLLLTYSEWFLTLLGQNPENAAIAQGYLRPFAGVMPLLMLRMVLEQILCGFKKQTPAMIISLITFSIGLFFAIVLCFGLFSFPQLGISGIAYGFMMDALLLCLGWAFYLGGHRDFEDYYFFSRFTLTGSWRQIKKLLKIGLPTQFTITNEIVAQLLINLFMGWFGTKQIAAQDLGTLFVFFSSILASCFGQATCQEVSREIGGKNYKNASRIATYGLMTSAVIMAPFCLLISLFPEFFIKLVISTESVDDEVASMTKLLMPITAVSVFFDALRFNMLQVLRASHDHNFPTAISTVTLWLGVLGGYLLGFKSRLGVYGVAMGYASGFVAGCCAIFSRWYKNTRPNVIAERDTKVRALASTKVPLLSDHKENIAVEKSNPSRSWFGFLNFLYKKPSNPEPSGKELVSTI